MKFRKDYTTEKSLVAGISVFAYILAGFLKSPWLPLCVAAVLLFVILMEIKRRQKV